MYGFIKKVSIILALVLAGMGAWYFYQYYQKIHAPNVLMHREDVSAIILVPPQSTVDDLLGILSEADILKDSSAFAWTAQMMEFTGDVKTGRYRLERGMNSRELVNHLRAGKQEHLKIRIPELRSKAEVAGYFGNKLLADSSRIHERMEDEEFLEGLGFTPETVLSLFIPDTYEFYWNTSTDNLFNRMKREHEHYWNEERLKQAETLGMSPEEIYTLASIVEAETYQWDEMPAIAGVYLNRLDRGMKLQADPTIVHILDDPGVRRILYHHLEIPSPYNTYLHTGLPPGPIGLAGKRALDAVLDAEEHDYLYFCAKADFSGYHNFSRTHREHQRCARDYHRALDELNS